MSGQGANAGAIVTALSWRGGDGRLRTTVVGKLSATLQADAPPSLSPSDPLVAFDRIAADHRFVEEASETAPWTVSASITTYGGPLRFTFYPTSGEPLLITTAQGAPVGLSMSNPERARYAPQRPKRAEDGVITYPDEIDGRYFIATPPAQHTVTIVGNERFVLEVGAARFDAKLPGVVIVVTVDVGGPHSPSQRRVVALPFDMLVVHGDRRRIALVGRALLPGEAVVVGHTLGPLPGAASPGATPSPEARPARRGKGAATAVLTEADLRAGTPAATPFGGRRTASDPNLAPSTPRPAATPFDKHFQPANVAPGIGLKATVPHGDDDQERTRAKLEAAIRKHDGGATEPRPPEPQAPPPQQPPQPKPQPQPQPKPQIAPPKPGAMAKPRVKRR